MVCYGLGLIIQKLRPTHLAVKVLGTLYPLGKRIINTVNIIIITSTFWEYKKLSLVAEKTIVLQESRQPGFVRIPTSL